MIWINKEVGGRRSLVSHYTLTTAPLRALRPKLDILNTIYVSNIVLLATFLVDVDDTISNMLMGLYITLHLAPILMLLV